MFARSVRLRFEEKVDKGKPDDCWEWNAARDASGYGAFKLKGEKVGAHRVAWMLANKEPIPEGEQVMHSCDNPACCNPKHLRLGSHSDNMADAGAKGRLYAQTEEWKHRSRQLFAKKDRNAVIRKLYREDVPVRIIARSFGLGTRRVYKILNAEV